MCSDIYEKNGFIISKMSNMSTGLVSHTRNVQSLYKRILKLLDSWYDRKEVYRFQATLMRDRFEKNRCIKDSKVAKELIYQAEKQLAQKEHWHTKQYPESPGGVAYQRVVTPPDWVVDYWHPLEKAQYPDYFARRERRKKEYAKMWEEKYGKSTYIPHH